VGKQVERKKTAKCYFAQYRFTPLVQRISSCNEIEGNSLTLNKAVNVWFVIRTSTISGTLKNRWVAGTRRHNRYRYFWCSIVLL